MKTVLITGGTRNTGFAIANHFARKGWNVAITSREEASAKEAAKKIEERWSVTAKGYALRFESEAEIDGVFQRVARDFGSLDSFIANSAHLGIGYDLLNSEEKDFDDIVGANLKGTFFCCKSAAKLMMKNGGSIVTIGSVQGTGAVEGRCIYGLTKAAIAHLVRSMAFELGQYGIRANNLVAGAIHSQRWDSLSEEEIAQRRSRYPVGRESGEDEIAAAVYFLASEESATITGTDLTVDSGILAGVLPYKKRTN